MLYRNKKIKFFTGDKTLETTYHIESLARGLAVLSAFSEEKPALSLTNISQRLQLNKTTTYRLLCTLVSLGYLQRDEQTKLYRPSLEVLRLGFVVLSGMEVRQIAGPHLRRLAGEVQETVNLVVLDQHEVVYIDRVGSKHMVSIYRPVGSRLPAYCTSSGKMLLAHLPPDELDRALHATTWIPFTDKTIMTPEKLKNNLTTIRQQGFAESYGEMLPELCAVAAPIRQHDGQVVAAINISAPSHRVSQQKLLDDLAPQVILTSQQISRGLGCPPESLSLNSITR